MHPSASMLRPTASMRNVKSFYLLTEGQVADVVSGSKAGEVLHGVCKKAVISPAVAERFLQTYHCENEVSLGGSHPFVRCLGSTSPNFENAYLYVTKDGEAAHWGKASAEQQPVEVLTQGTVTVKIFKNKDFDWLCLYSTSNAEGYALAHLVVGDEKPQRD